MVNLSKNYKAEDRYLKMGKNISEDDLLGSYANDEIIKKGRNKFSFLLGIRIRLLLQSK